jgi:hydrogenase-4 component F
MILLLIVIPGIAGLAAFAIRNEFVRRALLLIATFAHAAITVASWLDPFKPAPLLNGWLALDAAGHLILSIVSGLFLVVALYVIEYLRREAHGTRQDSEEVGVLFTNAPEAIFIGCLLLLLSAMSVLTVSQHFALFWVAMESSTLATGSLIYFHRHHRSLEAAWKYVLIGSVGIALALLGNFFLAAAASFGKGEAIPLVIGDLVRHAGTLNVTWLKAAFVLIFVGYGTKMGLAPMHTWKPDAYAESPAVVAALLSGALTNCAFLGILRAQQVCVAAGQGGFSQDMLIVLGLLSMAVAAIFILGQNDYKRLLAYSSVEHMGILVLGIGIGGKWGIFGALLHAINNALAKPMLFLVASNIRATYKTRSTAAVTGVLQVLPGSGALWLIGFLATTGFPPFGLFISEFTILTAAISQKQYVVAVLFLALLALIFIGVGGVVLRMAQGAPPTELSGVRPREPLLSLLSPAILGAAVLFLGVYMPLGLKDAIDKAVQTLGGG